MAKRVWGCWVQIGRVFIDRGHGPRNGRGGVFDPGAISGELREHDIVSAVASTFHTTYRHVLPIQLTDEESIPEVAAYVASHARPIDLFLALHMNAFDNPEATGVEVVFSHRRSDLARWAETLSDSIAETLSLKSRGAKVDTSTPNGRKKGLGLLNGTAGVPSFIVELGFLSNPRDVRQVLRFGAEAVYDGIQALSALR